MQWIHCTTTLLTDTIKNKAMNSLYDHYTDWYHKNNAMNSLYDHCTDWYHKNNAMNTLYDHCTDWYYNKMMQWIHCTTTVLTDAIKIMQWIHCKTIVLIDSIKDNPMNSLYDHCADWCHKKIMQWINCTTAVLTDTYNSLYCIQLPSEGLSVRARSALSMKFNTDRKCCLSL